MLWRTALGTMNSQNVLFSNNVTNMLFTLQTLHFELLGATITIQSCPRRRLFGPPTLGAFDQAQPNLRNFFRFIIFEEKFALLDQILLFSVRF